MDKTDHEAERKDLYSPPRGRFSLVDVPEMTFLAGPEVARTTRSALRSEEPDRTAQQHA